MDEVDLTLPKLKGQNIEEHFNIIANEQAAPYQKLISSLIKSDLPPLPKVTKLSIFTLKYSQYIFL